MRAMTDQDQQTRSLGRRFLGALLLVTGALFLYMIRAFLVPVLLAAVFATLLFPLYRRLEGWLRGRSTIAAILCLVIFLVGLIAPLYGVVGLVVREAVNFYQAGEWRAWVAGETPAFLVQLQAKPLWQDLFLDRVDWQATIRSFGENAGDLAGRLLDKTSRGTLHLVISLFITLFAMFYFFVDGAAIVRRLSYLSPLSAESDAAIGRRFASIARATVRGTVVICLIQGLLGVLTLWIFGVPKPLLWGAVMLVLAFVPLIGVKLVLLPAGLFQIATGNLWQGVGILVVSFVVILNVDNLLRPRLVGKDAGMHDLLIFLSTLGGFSLFGATGFIVGPVIAAFLLSLLDIYGQEYLTAARVEPPASPASEAAQATPVGVSPASP
jgi:predicted PurR-regulated permease PerM